MMTTRNEKKTKEMRKKMQGKDHCWAQKSRHQEKKGRKIRLRKK